MVCCMIEEEQKHFCCNLPESNLNLCLVTAAAFLHHLLSAGH